MPEMLRAGFYPVAIGAVLFYVVYLIWRRRYEPQASLFASGVFIHARRVCL
jgi:hypothetical protein